MTGLKNKDIIERLTLTIGESRRFNFKDSEFNQCFLKVNDSTILYYIPVGRIKIGITKLTIILSKIAIRIIYTKSVRNK
ncbi:MAG: hypothetical protein ACTSR8_09260 [Promethearchaeota archaeon]